MTQGGGSGDTEAAVDLDRSGFLMEGVCGDKEVGRKPREAMKDEQGP